MPLASLFNLAGPDLFVILVIVFLLFGLKRLPDSRWEFGRAPRRDKFATINRLLLVVAALSGGILLRVLLSQR